LLGALPTIFAVSGVIVVTLAYFATVDWLYMGRLAAYVAIVEFPSVPVIAEPASPSPRVIGPQATARIDAVSGFAGSEKLRWEGIPFSDDDILSDTPPDRS
jgi:hypothetical protein